MLLLMETDFDDISTVVSLIGHHPPLLVHVVGRGEDLMLYCKQLYVVQLTTPTPRVAWSMERSRVCYWRRLAGTRRPLTLSAALLSRARRRRRRRARNDADGTSEGGEWKRLGVPVPVVRALLEQGIRTPTEIQRRAITAALREQCDVIGAAETVCVIYHVATPLPHSLLPSLY